MPSPALGSPQSRGTRVGGAARHSAVMAATGGPRNQHNMAVSLVGLYCGVTAAKHLLSKDRVLVSCQAVALQQRHFCMAGAASSAQSRMRTDRVPASLS